MPCHRPVEEYEQLRSEALCTGLGGGTPLLGGLAAWLKPDPAPSRQPPPTEMPNHRPLPAALASIVQRLTKEAANA